jgi:hypothetical protein
MAVSSPDAHVIRRTDVNVRGVLVLRQRALMEGMAGRTVVQEVVASLGDPVMRASYEEASILSWVPQRAVRDVTSGVARAMGMSDVALAERVVERSVTELCTGPWNILLRMTDDDALIGRAAALFARSFDRGGIEVRRAADGVIEVILSGWPDAHEMDLASLAAGMLATLRSVGRDAVIERRARVGGQIYRVRVGA